MSASSSDALKRLAQVDAVVAGNPHAVGFDIAEVPVAGDVLDHDLVGIELDEAVALAPRLFFCKIHKSLAEARSEEHTSELQSLMRISYAVFCLKKNNSSNTS